jgi:hypothetical protein
MRTLILLLYVSALVSTALLAQSQQPDWKAFDEETMRHFQARVRFDTTDPPGGEKPAADYLKQILEKDGIPTMVFALEPNRPNVVARLKGSGKKRPLLLIGHTDTATWIQKNGSPRRFPPLATAATYAAVALSTTRTTSRGPL